MREGLAFVVYVDALGTSLNQLDYENQFAPFLDRIDKSFRGPEWMDWLVIKGFSDCVFFIFYFQDEKPVEQNESKLIEFFTKLGNFQGFCLDLKMPLRGGVSFGEASVDERHSQVITYISGIPVVQAVKLEECLKMCGISFAPRFMLNEKYHDEYDRWTDFLKENKLIVEFDTPTDFGLIALSCLKWSGKVDISKICEEYIRFQPEKAEDFIRQEKDTSIAAKYYAVSKLNRISCEKGEMDERK